MTHTSSESKSHLDDFLPHPLNLPVGAVFRLTRVVSVDISARASHFTVKMSDGEICLQ